MQHSSASVLLRSQHNACDEEVLDQRREAAEHAATEVQETSSFDAAVRRYIQGDNSAFALVYPELARRLWRYFQRRTHNAAHTEDLLQQTLTEIHNERACFSERASFSGNDALDWMMRVAASCVVQHVKLRRNDSGLRRVMSSFENPSTSTDEWVHWKLLLLRISERFRVNQREALEAVVGARSLREWAECTGISYSAVKMRSHRARQELRRRLARTRAVSLRT